MKTEEQNIEILENQNLPIQERRTAYLELQEEKMNPDKDFNPNTFDPMKGIPNYEVVKRERAEPPKRLTTFGMKPKKILQGQMIGMFESKQDLYLLMAHYINNLLDRVEELENRLPKR
jgi:hypothetical protein